MHLNLRNKILFSVLGLIVGLTVAALFVVNLQVRNQIQAQARTEFATVTHSFNNYLYLRGQQLIESCLLISRYPAFVDPVLRKDPQNARLIVIELMADLQADLFTVTGETGVVLTRFDSPIFGDNIGSMPSVRGALSGKDVDSVDVWSYNGQLYLVATAFVLAPGSNFIIGTVTLGQKVTDVDAQDLSRATRADISFILENNVVASSAPQANRADLIRAFVNNKESIEEMFGRNSTYTDEVELAGDDYFNTFAPIAPGRPGLYAISIPLEPQLQSLRRIQQVIFFVGAAGILIAVGLALVIARNITSPVSKLVEATQKVRDGQFDIRVTVDTKDEIGTLASSFNAMVAGLRERSFMQKFVSSSTLEMIHGTQDAMIALGGERKIVTVFFSDIRGFTAYSERVPPEDVIEMLNTYLSIQARIIKRHGGVVDKYVGDEVVAIFQGEEMVDQAVESAVEIQKETGQLSEKHPEHIKVGIGINTGMVILGNVGSEERMDHTVLGNNVNLGSRLCSMAQPGQIVLSESAYRMMKLKVQTRPLEAIPVKGISLPVQTYEVCYGGISEKRDATSQEQHSAEEKRG